MRSKAQISRISAAIVLCSAGSAAAQTLDSPVFSSGGASAADGSVFTLGQSLAREAPGASQGAVFGWDPISTLRSIRNGLVGDGVLAVTTDAYGSIQLFSALENEDSFNAPGAPPAAHPTYSSAFYIFIGTTQRELLSDSYAWQHYDFTGAGNPSQYFSADTSLERSVIDCCTQADTNADGVFDWVASAFSITGVGVNLGFELVQSISEPDADSAAYLRQDYTITNQNTVP